MFFNLPNLQEIFLNDNKIKLVTINPPIKRQYKKPTSKKIIKNRDIDSDDSDDSDDSKSTNQTNNTSRFKKIKDFADDSNDMMLTSSNLPSNLLDDDDDDKNNILKSKKYTNTKLAKTEHKQVDPASFYTDPDELKEKLKYYKRVESSKVADLPMGTRIKYIEVLQNNMFKYKPGGVIMVNKAPVYLVLAENRKSWSVQLKTHIIFVEQFDQIRKNYETLIKSLTDKIDQMTIANTNLRIRNIELEKKIKK